jgi:hypothetical protein
MLALLSAAGLCPAALAGPTPMLTLDALQHAPATVLPANATEVPADVKLVRDWSGSLCRARLVNGGKTPVRIREVVLFDVHHDLPPEREPCRVTDYWTGADLGRREGTVEVKDVPGHSGRLLVCEPVAR